MIAYVNEDTLYLSEVEGNIISLLQSFSIPLKTIHHFIQTKQIKINDETITFDTIVHYYDYVSINIKEECQYIPSGSLPNIIYEDDHYLIVDKPSMQLVHDDENSLCHDVATYLNNRVIRFAGRLDYETTGLVMFYKHFVVSSAVDQLMMNHELNKTYLAIVEGEVTKDGTISLPIGKDRHTNKQRISQTGKQAITHYTVEQIKNKKTLLSVSIETGRKHQIRVHMYSIGHPIVGDPLYGKKANRMALHCFRLVWKDPFSNIDMSIESKPSLSFNLLNS